MQALTTTQLKKTYSNHFQALDNVNIAVEQGDFFSLLGPNGAGKSTLIGIITSLVNKTAGKVEIFGHDIDHQLNAAKACIGLVPQEINLAIFETPLQILINAAGYYGVRRRLAKQRAEQYLKQLHLWEKRDTQVTMLSGGMKRRLMIARALMHQPRLLLLDEPTAGVDIEIRRSMWEFLNAINAQGTTIILTTHYLEEAENLCRHTALIDHGKIQYQGAMSAFLQTLKVETFILYLQQALSTLPQIDNYVLRQIEPTVLEVDIDDSQSLNQLFAQLSQHGIDVNRMKNKSNRLEELFVRLTRREHADV